RYVFLLDRGAARSGRGYLLCREAVDLLADGAVFGRALHPQRRVERLTACLVVRVRHAANQATCYEHPWSHVEVSTGKILGRSISDLNGDGDYVGLLAGVRQRTRMPLVVEQVDRFDLEVAEGVGGAARPREQEALRQAAAHAAQDLELLPGLDAFGHHLDVQAARHGDDGADDG